MTRALRRLAPSGVGPAIVFRAITANVPLLQTPQSWVRNQPAFERLAADCLPDAAAALQAAGVLEVEKVWTELAYESVRAAAARDWPSRLDSLFAFADPVEAFDFGYETLGVKQAWEGTVPDGVAWAQVDMSVFRVERVAAATPAEFADAWQRAERGAHDYWSRSADPEVAEILVAGPIQLVRRVTLTDLFRTLGILE